MVALVVLAVVRTWFGLGESVFDIVFTWIQTRSLQNLRPNKKVNKGWFFLNIRTYLLSNILFFEAFFKKGDEVKTISKDVTERQERRLSRKMSKLMDEIRIGRILILISSFYILLTLPHTIDQFHYLLYKTDDYEKRFYGLDEILASLSYLLLTINYSLNFYFYCLINQDIRKDVKNFVKRHFNTCTK